MTMTAREFLRRMENEATEPFDNAPRCVRCGKVLSESVTGSRRTADGYVDSDCYYDGLSTIVEANPIFTPRLRRG